MLSFSKPLLRWSEPREYYRALQEMAKQENLKAYIQENLAFPFLLGFFFGWVFAIGANMAAGAEQQLSDHIAGSAGYGLFFGLVCLGIHYLDRIVRPVVLFTSRKIIRKSGRTKERFSLDKIDHYAIENREVKGRNWRCLVLFMPKRIVPCTTLVLDDSVDEKSIADFFSSRNIRKTKRVTGEEVMAAIEANLS